MRSGKSVNIMQFLVSSLYGVVLSVRKYKRCEVYTPELCSILSRIMILTVNVVDVD